MLWPVDKNQRNEPTAANLMGTIQHYSEMYSQARNRCGVAAGWADGVNAPRRFVAETTKHIRQHHFLLTLNSNLDTADGGAKMIKRGKK